LHEKTNVDLTKIGIIDNSFIDEWNYATISEKKKIVWPPLSKIPLGQIKSDNINRIIKATRFFDKFWK